ncbi:DNA mismatch repair protein MutT [Paenibacillus agaridevorans]|uniref:DNA mismatch repair protein MutT n=1 Tax=Paenibacillus agaridevorans TaxID=171404 RepID=A0A2R5EQ64_9BACL|nr:NUDIX hydrolase [Paenibacillus agaridevorans]GBG08245.1 DNA mismatch repair protein MutT [Paenibacillus agaridevorans]
MYPIIAQAVILQNDSLLMVRQYVQRGDIVWNFPGGGIEINETPEMACIREVKEETGIEVKGLYLIHEQNEKYTYLITKFEGQIKLDKNNKDNEDIIEVQWISQKGINYLDSYTKPIMDIVSKKLELKSS